MATDFSALGSSEMKAVSLNDVNVYHSSEDNYKFQIRADSAPASDIALTLPNQAGQILCDADSIALSQTDIDGASAETSPTSSMTIPIFNGSANRKMTLANLSTLSGLGFPSATDAQILVADTNGDYASVDASGDVSVSNTGAFTVADDAISSAKIADDAVSDAKIEHAPDTDGTAQASKYVKTDASNDISSLNKLSAVDVNVSGTFELSTKWRLNLSGENLQLEYSSDGGSTYSVRQIFSAS